MKKKNRKNDIFKKSKQRSFARASTVKTKRRSEAITLTGRFLSTSVGGVFFEIKADGALDDKKYFIDSDGTRGAINGDTVTVRAKPSNNSAYVIEINERAVKTVIGTLYEDGRYYPPQYVQPDDTKLRFNVSVVGNDCKIKPADGDKVEITITEYPESMEEDASGIITAVFGDSCSREANYSAILREHGIVTEFGEEALADANSHEHDLLSPIGRADIRNEAVFTIDGAGAKDLDDAISAERDGEGYILGVHIADVSHYVREGTALDKEAMRRGTSVYFSDKVVPMLPVALSNGICSLNAGVDRYTLSVFVKLDKFGEIKDASLKRTIINSKVRGVYSEINAIIEGVADAEIEKKYSSVKDTLDIMLEMYAVLKRKSEKRGALDLDSNEAEIILDENGEPSEIVKRERGDGERLIEQFMLCANEAVASWLSSNGLPCVYRIHEDPEWDKVSDFIKFAHNLKLRPEYVKKENIRPAYFGKILDKARKEGLSVPVSYMLLRTMKKARYSELNTGHFGLSCKRYCHFTSPIRRYPDLSVHRIINYVLDGHSVQETVKKYTSFASISAKTSSENELSALEAERDIDDLYKTIYMKKHIGQEFDATISSVTSFGLFCELENTCEGLVPLRTMKNRYYFDPENMTLSSRNVTYRLGDKLKIRVENANVSLRLIDFSLTDEPDEI